MFCRPGHFVCIDVCYSRCFVPLDVLSFRTFCPSARFVLPDVLSFRTFCPSGHFVLSGHFVPPVVLSHGHNVSGCYVSVAVTHLVTRSL